MALLDVQDLRVRFETHHGVVRAVDGVSFQLDEGETLGLVGESGSGKSVTNLALMGLLPQPPAVIEADSLRFDGHDLLRMTDKEFRHIRGNEMSMIFQDPMTSLNPLLTIGRQLTEVIEVHERKATRKDVRRRSAGGLADVGIPEPWQRLDQYPHELSGGMRQRVMIAMALLCRPKVLLADEPTTALDVTIQAQILELLKKLQHGHGTAVVLVTHDLGVVAGMADRVNVMYAGKLVETSPTGPLFENPLHPYTRGLLGSVPRLTGDPHAQLTSIPGAPPDLADLPAGCSFHPRCDFTTERCERETPPLYRISEERKTACSQHESLPGGAANAYTEENRT